MMVLSVGFRLLTEYHSFLFKKYVKSIRIKEKFPSPYGVSFILMQTDSDEFKELVAMVSVSLRSIIHSYSIVASFYTIVST